MADSKTPAQRILLWIGSIGPLGHAPASGTVTVAVIGIPWFWLTRSWSWPWYVLVSVLFAGAAIWLHDVGDRILGEKDSRCLVWDELAGFFVAVTLVPFSWPLAILAFFLERALDIVKIPPARYIEDHWPGGWGVVGDDLVAGLYTCALLHLLLRLMPDILLTSA